MARIHPAHCDGSCSPGAGPSQPSSSSSSSSAQAVQAMASLIERASDTPTEFDVNITPPKTCEVMNVTFSTAGGTPPYTVFLGFENWFAYTVSLPSSYADDDVSTWLYQFSVPYFPPGDYGSTEPYVVAIVGDSSGKLLNSSSLLQVKQQNINCAPTTGHLDFTFSTEGDTSAVCGPVPVVWYREPINSTAVTWKDPLTLYLLPEQQPPILIPIANSSLGGYNYTLHINPGTFYMFSMTDQDSSGGVSGRNLAGFSEYISTDCLAKPDAFLAGMPKATETIASTVRMPDFSAVVSSTVTSNGRVTTATSVEVVRHGSVQGADVSSGEIAGIAVAIAVVAAIAAALISWCVWRRRHGRRTTLWDVPRGAEGALGKSTAAPIDRNFLKSARQASSTGSMTAPMLTLSPQSVASDERVHQTIAPSDSSFVDSHHGSYGSPSTAFGEATDSRSNTASAWGTGSSSHQYASLPSGEGLLHAAGGRRMSTSSSATGNPFVQPSSSARAYRSDESEAHPLQETRRRSAASSSARGSLLMTPTQSHSTHKQPPVPALPQHVVQHQDAGLLMDDSLDDEELLGRVELPPSYHQIQRPGLRDANRRQESSLQELDLGSVVAVAEEDESEFWRSSTTS